MPTEQNNEIGELISTKGKELGTVTGRRRRCGWFDAVMVKQALRFGGARALIITKLDVLDGFEYLRICCGYRLRGEILDYMPSSRRDQEEVEPIYEEMPGWTESTYGVTDIGLLPKRALEYIHKIESIVCVPVVMLSTTPVSEDVLVINQELFDIIVK